MPVQYTLDCETSERKIPSGNTYYVPNVSLDMEEVLAINENVQDTFRDFVEWVTNYNSYITTEWEDKNVNNISSEDMTLVEEFITVDAHVEN